MIWTLKGLNKPPFQAASCCRLNNVQVQLWRTTIMFSLRRTSAVTKPPTPIITEVSDSESSIMPEPDSGETLKSRLQKKHARRSLHIHAQEAGVRKHRNRVKSIYLNPRHSTSIEAHHLREAEIPVSSGLVAYVRQDTSLEKHR